MTAITPTRNARIRYTVWRRPRLYIVPFIILQLISALKNASMAGFIKAELLNEILDRIDKHKGIRK